jgi:hypothetical protein
MWVIDQIKATENGIVLFDPAVLLAVHGGAIRKGKNLFREYTTQESGDRVLSAGAIIPILGIDWYDYTIIVRLAGEPSSVGHLVVKTNGTYPCHVSTRLVVAGLGSITKWNPSRRLKSLPVPPGNYAAKVNGYRRLNARQTELVECGYEIVLTRRRALPKLTAETDADLDVTCWWE